MARIITSALISSIQGSIGHGTFQRSQGGLTLRNKPVPRSPETIFQLNSKLYLSRVIAAWQSMTSSQLNLWYHFISLSPTKMKHNPNIAISAYNLFIKYNLIRLHSGLDILIDITLDYLCDSTLGTLTLFLDADQLYFEVTQEIDPESRFILIRLTKPIPNPSYNYYSLLRVIPLSPLGLLSWYIENEYLSHFYKLPEVGDICGCRYTLFSTISPVILQRVSKIVTVVAP